MAAAEDTLFRTLLGHNGTKSRAIIIAFIARHEQHHRQQIEFEIETNAWGSYWLRFFSTHFFPLDAQQFLPRLTASAMRYILDPLALFGNTLSFL